MSTERLSNIPDFAVSVDGVDITPKIKGTVIAAGAPRPRLISLSITDKRGGEADQLDLILDDSDGKLALPRKGADIRVRLGWRQGADVVAGLVDKGRFTVDEVAWGGPPDQVTIRARSADMTGALRHRREAGYKRTTLGQLARDVAGRHGLAVRVAPELAGVDVPVLAQHHQSDLALLRRLGRGHDAVATVKDKTLILSPIGRAAAPGGGTLPGLTIARSTGDQVRYAEVDRSADAGVEARFHDQDKGVRETVKVGGADGKPPKRVRKVHHSKADAEAAAKAEASRTKRAEVECEVTLALGRPDLIPERPVKLAGFKREVDARAWIIAELTHRLDSGGLSTSVKLEIKG